LDNTVYSAPVIREKIGGGRASITGSFDIKEARDLAIVLRAGALPAPVAVAEERTIGPSLGKTQLTKACSRSLSALFGDHLYGGVLQNSWSAGRFGGDAECRFSARSDGGD
jgi:hypothetical protein